MRQLHADIATVVSRVLPAERGLCDGLVRGAFGGDMAEVSDLVAALNCTPDCVDAVMTLAYRPLPDILQSKTCEKLQARLNLEPDFLEKLGCIVRLDLDLFQQVFQRHSVIPQVEIAYIFWDFFHLFSCCYCFFLLRSPYSLRCQ